MARWRSLSSLLLPMAMLLACSGADQAPAASRVSPGGPDDVAGQPAFVVVSPGTMLASPGYAPEGTRILILSAAGSVLAQTAAPLFLARRFENASNLLGNRPPVVLAAGAAFWMDFQGTIRRLDRSGAVSTVTTIPLADSPVARFAVSPDGSMVMATVVNMKQAACVPAGAGSCQVPTSVTTFLAPAGKPPGQVALTPLPTWQGKGVTMVVGWDAGGPLATLDTWLSRADQPASWNYFGAPMIHLGTDGARQAAVSGPAPCYPIDRAPGGIMLCGDSLVEPFKRVDIRSAQGTTVWQVPVGSSMLLAPDGKHVASFRDGTIYAQAGAPLRLPTGSGQVPVLPVGWLDPQHLVVQRDQPGSHLGLFSLDRPGAYSDWGVAGIYVGRMN